MLLSTTHPQDPINAEKTKDTTTATYAESKDADSGGKMSDKYLDERLIEIGGKPMGVIQSLRVHEDGHEVRTWVRIYDQTRNGNRKGI